MEFANTAKDAQLLAESEESVDVDSLRDSSLLPQVLESCAESSNLKIRLLSEILRAPEGLKTQKIREAAQILRVHRTTIIRTLKRVRNKGWDGLAVEVRADKGKFRISKEWHQFIVQTYLRGQKNSLRINRNQVFNLVKAHAELNLGLKQGEYPSHVTVYKVLAPYIEKARETQRHPGQGKNKVARTTDGDIPVTYSNQIWQADHTKADILLVDDKGEIIGCPFLTIIVDHYSGCLMGYYVGFEAPGAFEVGLALRHAMLPKHYGPEYKLEQPWIERGIPDYLFTDRAKEFKSLHLKKVASHLGIKLRRRAYPQAGGVVESVFGKNNTELLSHLLGYKGSNVQTRPVEAEKNACVTLEEFEQLMVRYFSQHYNLHQYPKVRDTLRRERWQASLLGDLPIIDERKLDVCLLKTKKRKVEKHESFNFECLKYQVKALKNLPHKYIQIRYDPRDISTVLVYSYSQESELSEYIGLAHARDLEKTRISLKEWRLIKRKMHQQERKIDNVALLSERLDLQQFSEQKRKEKSQRKCRWKAQDKLEEKTLQDSQIAEIKGNVMDSQDGKRVVQDPPDQQPFSDHDVAAESQQVSVIENWDEFLSESW
ncbi:Mu transposase C-terminal domain-containing protein [Acaryochloris marina]|uniref:Mu transposase C-terminal domain-containing protein n=1 Tax=Acaryochloris marina TaxID=155978 RepID=UPI001BAEF2CA|nr:Mu transposase C-terminal domain-containing protein [Acaryochloris marina]QUY40684.1 DDE-type integrase/transposase/recombinase [Acaryochloris marina S15]